MQKAKLTTMLTLFLAMAAFLLPTKTQALIPYTRPSLFDMMFPPPELDPFRILEHSPLGIPSRDAADDPIALARADWKETPTAHEISLDIPGMKKEDVKIEVEAENRLLSISGERKTEEEVQDERWHRAERTVGKFWRQFRLPANADLENVTARLVDGVLRISMPKLGDEGVMKKKEPKVISVVSDDNDDKGNVVKATKNEL